MTTPPIPPALQRSRRPTPASRLERWRDAEPVRLYAYTVLAALSLVLVATGALTGDVGHALTGLAAAVLGIVPAAELGRLSVQSPVTVRQLRREDSVRWAAAIRSGQLEDAA